MNHRRLASALGLLGAAFVPWAAGCQAPPTLGELDESILSGAEPPRGSLRIRGVVWITGGCSGTLLTNQHVLTGQRCLKDWTPETAAGFSATLEDTTLDRDRTIASRRVFLPPQPDPGSSRSDAANDYAVLELREPFRFGGTTDDFFNPIYPEDDSTLQRQTVFCVGYGNNVPAIDSPDRFQRIPQTGAGTLRTATLEVFESAGRVLMLIPNSRGQITTDSDHGSTCFYNDQLTGVLSACRGRGFDFDGDGRVEPFEFSRIIACESASPDSYRAFVQARTMADVQVEYRFAPALNPSPTSRVTVTTKANTGTTTTNGTLKAIAPRSGWVKAQVDTEPTNYLCPQLHGRTPLDGAAQLRGTCLGEGLVSVLIDA